MWPQKNQTRNRQCEYPGWAGVFHFVFVTRLLFAEASPLTT